MRGVKARRPPPLHDPPDREGDPARHGPPSHHHRPPPGHHAPRGSAFRSSRTCRMDGCAPPSPRWRAGGAATSAQAVAVLARTQQDAVWNRQQVATQLRSLLEENLPPMIEALRDKPGTLTRPDARWILAVAPTPALGAMLWMGKLTAILRRAGRRRGMETDAEPIQQLFRAPCSSPRRTRDDRRRLTQRAPEPIIVNKAIPGSLSSLRRGCASAPAISSRLPVHCEVEGPGGESEVVERATRAHAADTYARVLPGTLNGAPTGESIVQSAPPE